MDKGQKALDALDKLANESEFRAWRRRLSITSQADAALIIGRSRRQIAAYEAGAEIPRVVRLAMLAIEYLPYNDECIADRLKASQLKARR